MLHMREKRAPPRVFAFQKCFTGFAAGSRDSTGPSNAVAEMELRLMAPGDKQSVSLSSV